MQTEFTRGNRSRVIAPLSLAAYITWAAIAASAVPAAALSRGDVGVWLGLGALIIMLALFVLQAMHVIDPCRHRVGAILALLMQGVMVVVAQHLLGSAGVSVLLIIVSGQLFTMLSVPIATAILVLLNAAVLALWRQRGFELDDLLLSILPMLGFQAFAALTAMYAERSERGREALADLNAELLATQRLLEESTRSDERLRLSRELHDVAGHKLTAMKLNLRAMQRDPTLSQRDDVALCLQLADELLGDIRGVVGELRQHDGVDLGAALAALSHPLRGVVVEVDGRDQVRVPSVAVAETLLRITQEGLTNAVRHGQSTQVRVALSRDSDGLTLSIEDNGRGRLPVAEGNGLHGMRERLAALGGRLAIEQANPTGLRLRAHLPVAA